MRTSNSKLTYMRNEELHKLSCLLQSCWKKALELHFQTNSDRNQWQKLLSLGHSGPPGIPSGAAHACGQVRAKPVAILQEEGARTAFPNSLRQESMAHDSEQEPQQTKMEMHDWTGRRVTHQRKQGETDTGIDLHSWLISSSLWLVWFVLFLGLCFPAALEQYCV